MSLLTEAMTECILLNKVRTPDGEGGFITQWTDGGAFKAAITFDASMQARIGEQAGVTSRYTVTTQKNITLEYHDVFRRETDKKIFRVTSDGDDKFTPASATLNMRQMTAEEWELV